MTFVRHLLLLLILLSTVVLIHAQPDTPPPPIKQLDMSPFSETLSSLSDERIAELDAIVFEATVADLQAAMQGGELDSVSLVTYYLYRIQEYDQDGLNSVLELNPDVLVEALELDEERMVGNIRGPLHGIPILLKDNISTVGPMHTTAGAAVLMDNISDRDAFIVTQLREAGAIIVGKGNLSEFANWVDPDLPSGFSAIGGQTLSPYDPTFDPSGSSTGPAVAVSANLATVAVGTETSGSIISPASVNGIVGMYPSRGLVSRDRIVPLAESQDTAGPITRNVTDAALLLTIMSGVDENDVATNSAASLAGTDFTSFLDPKALQGKTVGVVGLLPDFLENDELLATLGWDVILDGIESAGAEFVILEVGESPRFQLTALLEISFGIDIIDYLQAIDPDGSMQTVSDIVMFNNTNPELYIPYGQDYLEASANSTVSRDEYLAGVEELRSAAAGYLDQLIEENEVDVIVSIGNNLSGIYPTAGYPAITVPGGLNSEDRPFGATFVGQYLSDGELLGMAYAFEQASQARVIPPVGIPEN
jgi:amidase